MCGWKRETLINTLNVFRVPQGVLRPQFKNCYSVHIMEFYVIIRKVCLMSK